MTHVIDAHALVWFVAKDPRLSKAAKQAMEDATADLLVPAIALAEACWVVEGGQIVAAATRIIDRGGSAAVITRDSNIVQSKLVPIVW